MDEEAINKQKQDICEVFKNAIKLSDLTASEVFDEYAIFNLTYRNHQFQVIYYNDEKHKRIITGLNLLVFTDMETGNRVKTRTDNHYGKDIDDLVYEVCKKTTKEYLPNDEYFSSTELNNIFSNNPNAQVSVVSETEHGGVTSHQAYLSQINKVIVLNWLGGIIIKLQILTKYVGLRVSSAAKRDNIYDE